MAQEAELLKAAARRVVAENLVVVGVLAAQDGGPGRTARSWSRTLSKVVPLSMSSDSRLGMCRARGFKSFTARSSVRMRITLGGFGSCFWVSACCPSAEGSRRRGAGHGHPEERVHGYKEYSLGLIHYLHVRIAGRCTEGRRSDIFSFTPGRVFASIFESPRPSGSVFHPG